MAKPAIARCWCCGFEYPARVLRIVRQSWGDHKAVNHVCATCQGWIAHAKTAEEEARK